jgi:hypothetical protein
MAKHGEHEKEHEEHEKRARGGKLEQPKEAEEADEVERKGGGKIPPQFRKHIEEEEEHAKKRARGGALAHEGDVGKIHERGHKKIKVSPRKRVLKRGGRVQGEKPKMDMARRARGGATPEKNPLSVAGRMENPPYVKMDQPTGHPKGSGKDIGTHLGKA